MKWKIAVEDLRDAEKRTEFVHSTREPLTAATSRAPWAYVIYGRRRFLFWSFWKRAAITRSRREAEAWSRYFHVPLPDPPA